MRRRRLVAALVALAVVAAPAAGCGDDGGGDRGAEPADRTVTTAAAGPPYAVETTTETFVDEDRPTDDPGGALSAPTRTLATDLYVPEGPGPFPLVVLAHGFNGHPRKFTELATAWAEAGMVVAVPAFPLTNEEAGAPTVLNDYANQPGDVSFVIDEVLRHLDVADPERIGVAGHSLGGATAYGVVYHDCCRDDRVDAAVLLSTLPLPFDGGDFRFADGPPVLLVQLTDDPIVPYQQAVDTYDRVDPPRFLVTLEAGGHFEPYENAPSDHDAVVEETTTAFWEAYLGGDEAAVDRLVEAAESADATRIAADP
ncbi:MAG TPA: hypothetical protein VIL48_17885 [Acidimicrobiales bacterium]